MFPSSSTDNRGLIRRNRPSLMRQNEVAGSGTPSPDVHANAHAKFLSDSPFVKFPLMINNPWHDARLRSSKDVVP